MSLVLLGMPHFLVQFREVCENLITLEQVRFHQNTVQISVDCTIILALYHQMNINYLLSSLPYKIIGL